MLSVMIPQSPCSGGFIFKFLIHFIHIDQGSGTWCKATIRIERDAVFVDVLTGLMHTVTNMLDTVHYSWGDVYATEADFEIVSQIA